jgi:hypothetical protein
MSKAMIDTQINTITEMLHEFNEKTDKCDNKNILSFAKTIGENFEYLTEQIRGSSSLNVIEKVKLSQEVERLEHEFGNINDSFSKCKCNK